MESKKINTSSLCQTKEVGAVQPNSFHPGDGGVVPSSGILPLPQKCCTVHARYTPLVHCPDGIGRGNDSI